jgi:threonine 3-dehydrogenase
MSGSPAAYNDAFRIVRNGGTVLLLGLTRKPLSEFDIANAVVWKGITVKGIFGRKMFETWETMLRLLRSDRFNTVSNLSRIIGTKDYTLNDYQLAFERLISGQEMKLVFEPQI